MSKLLDEVKRAGVFEVLELENPVAEIHKGAEIIKL